MALSKIDVANMLTGATPISNGGTGLTTNVSRPNEKSLIINGNMDVWQRATSATAVTGAYATVDRYKISEDTDGSYTTERHTMSNAEKQTTGFDYALKAVCTGTDSSIGASQTAEITQKIEAQNCQVLQYGTSNAKNLTLAFWVKSSKTGTYCVAIRKRDSTSYDIPIEYTISSADTWEKKVINISPTAGSTSLITSSGGAIANDNGEGIFVLFALAIGSNFHGTNNTWVAATKVATSNQVNWMDSTDNNFYLTGVQLEVGEYTSSTLPPFQHESFADNLARCHRYCYVMGASANAEDGGQFTIGSGLVRSSGSAKFTDIVGSYPQPLRTLPSVTQVGGDMADLFCYKDDGTSADPTSISIGRNTIALKLTNNMGTSSGLTAGDATIQQIVEDDTDLVFDAEL